MPPRFGAAPHQRGPAPGRPQPPGPVNIPGSRPGPANPPAPSQPNKGAQPGAGSSKSQPSAPSKSGGNSSTAKASSPPPVSASSTGADPTSPKTSSSSPPPQTAIAATTTSAHGQTDAPSTTQAPSPSISTVYITLPNGSVSTTTTTVYITTYVTTNGAGGLQTVTTEVPAPTTSPLALHANRAPAIIAGILVGLFMLVGALALFYMRCRRLRRSPPPPPPMRVVGSGTIASRPDPRDSHLNVAVDPFAGVVQAWSATEDGADVVAPAYGDSDALSSSDGHLDTGYPSEKLRAGVRLSQFAWHERTPSTSDGDSLAATDDFASPPPSPRPVAAPGSTSGQSVAAEDGHVVRPRLPRYQS